MATDPTGRESSLGQRVVWGGAAFVALTVGLHTLAAIRLLLLARLLDPRAFGLVGAAQALLVLLDALSGLSVQSALVRVRVASRELLDTAWTLEVMRGVLQAGLLFLLAPLLGAFVSSAETTTIARALALAPLIGSLLNVGIVDFTRELRVGRYAGLQLSASLADFVVAVALALVLHSAWALVAGSIALNVCRVAASYLLHTYRPRLCIDRRALGELLGFGRWALAASAFGWVLGSGVPLAVGRVLGLPALGLYQMAWKVAWLPVQELGRAAAHVTYPAYAAIHHEPERATAALEKVLKVVALMLFPPLAWLAVSQDALSVALLGPKWAAAGPLLALLALAAALRTGAIVVLPVARAAGDTRKEAVVGGLELLAVLAALPALLDRLGLRGAVCAVLLGATVSGVTAFLLVLQGWRARVAVVGRGIGAPLLAALAIPAVMPFALGHRRDLFSLLLSAGLAEGAFVAGLLLLDWFMSPKVTTRSLLAAGWLSVVSACSTRVRAPRARS